MPSLVILTDADALRAHLDALNEDGQTPVAVGWTAGPYSQPFLITLVGCYADGEDVLFDSPWQSDIDYGERINGVWAPLAPRCDECMGHVHEMKHLRFPVTVMAAGGAS
jgi:hypothetical protein